MAEKDEYIEFEEAESTDHEDDEQAKITNPIIQHHVTTIKTFYDQYLTDELGEYKLCLTPDYQRDFAWNRQKQNMLISSIMDSYVIPMYVLYKPNVVDRDAKKKNHKECIECIDGQHRLMVIKHYIESKPIDSNYIVWRRREEGTKRFINYLYKETPETKGIKIANKRYMSIAERRDFDSFKLDICEITNILPREQIQCIFNRLQQGQNVNSAEQMKNINHPVIVGLNIRNLFKHETITGLTRDKLFDYGIKNIIKTSIKIRFINLIMRAVYICKDNRLDSVSYLDMNIQKYIKNNAPRCAIDSNKKAIEYIDYIISFINVLNELISQDNKYKNITFSKTTIFCKYIFYILLHLYKKHNENKKLLLKHLYIVDEDYDYFNSFETYEGDKRNKIVSGDEMNKISSDIENRLSQPKYIISENKQHILEHHDAAMQNARVDKKKHLENKHQQINIDKLEEIKEKPQKNYQKEKRC